MSDLDTFAPLTRLEWAMLTMNTFGEEHRQQFLDLVAAKEPTPDSPETSEELAAWLNLYPDDDNLPERSTR